MALSLMAVSIFCSVTVIAPVPLVATLFTYFVVAVELSQPQSPALGSVDPTAD